MFINTVIDTVHIQVILLSCFLYALVLLVNSKIIVHVQWSFSVIYLTSDDEDYVILIYLCFCVNVMLL